MFDFEGLGHCFSKGKKRNGIIYLNSKAQYVVKASEINFSVTRYNFTVYS